MLELNIVIYTSVQMKMGEVLSLPLEHLQGERLASHSIGEWDVEPTTKSLWPTCHLLR